MPISYKNGVMYIAAHYQFIIAEVSVSRQKSFHPSILKFELTVLKTVKKA